MTRVRLLALDEILDMHIAYVAGKFDRRCCWWGCGSPGQITTYEGRSTYFCGSDKCNSPGIETALGPLGK